MRKIIYHVASTLDGYIAHKDGTTKGFLEEGEHVSDYLESLKEYDTVIMGMHTYEYGYNYGLRPGQPAYPHMMNYIFSRSLHFENAHEQVKVIGDNQIDALHALKETVGSPIYMCGGGKFASFLLAHKLIDELKIKLNPVLFGAGIKLFEGSEETYRLRELNSIAYKGGVFLLNYEIDYL
ncbi:MULTISPECIES: dihydrofolate reductase family protein [unclassified Imperialibacter]|uniref:dihydrofolate reductase family protein n=1 Tax=unclassified Imperialibacter TaxID=2629706 RepID=UPI001253E25C|nr:MULTISPECIES: dihydrofolate reductase family protein [unclassified Imperialibacter]CAD5293394.1 Dihydrofolate reductase [Imperialibacter sp. 89]CAD5294488.1 Dihydrofolate reductase [Imperialibacter sp. 75]VVT18249.1 Dihydrofolate reductase [Imperialibacter sp. EC-SDR9]